MDGGGGKTECKRLGVGGRVDLGCMNKGHKFLARSEAVGIAASTRRGSMVRRDGAGVELTTRKGMHMCTAELGGRDGRGGGLVDDGRVMLAMYSGCTGVGSGCGTGENERLSSMSRTGEAMSGMVSMRVGRDESTSTVSSSVDGVQRAS